MEAIIGHILYRMTHYLSLIIENLSSCHIESGSASKSAQITAMLDSSTEYLTYHSPTLHYSLHIQPNRKPLFAFSV